MNKKQVIVICLAAACLLSGCGGRVGCGKGGIKYTVPFDLPNDKADLNNEKASGV